MPREVAVSRIAGMGHGTRLQQRLMTRLSLALGVAESDFRLAGRRE
jgi:hypothetical protein